VPDAPRNCPVCNSRAYILFAEDNITACNLNSYAYSSRKTPEFMCHKLVKCMSCELIYALSPPDESFLKDAYGGADYDSSEAAACAADSYSRALAPHVGKLWNKSLAVDVGAGNGALLPHLLRQGFAEVVGVEPSLAAVEAAEKDVYPRLRQEMFSRESLAGRKADLLCSFMTLEHVPNPGRLFEIAYDALAPGGLLAVVVHDYAGMLNRMLGKRSPIIDLEHLQLFNRKSIRTLYERAGLHDVVVKPMVNTYPLHYWLQLMPLPNRIKNGMLHGKGLAKVLAKRVSFNVGNLFVVGSKR